MRLIDADKLMLHKSLLVEPRDKTVSTGKPVSDDEVYAYRLGKNAVIDEIIDAPTVDAVEVVRCKDCCHCIHNEFFDTYCCWKFSWSIPVEKDSFCSWGERREDGKH